MWWCKARDRQRGLWAHLLRSLPEAAGLRPVLGPFAVTAAFSLPAPSSLNLPATLQIADDGCRLFERSWTTDAILPRSRLPRLPCFLDACCCIASSTAPARPASCPKTRRVCWGTWHLTQKQFSRPVQLGPPNVQVPRQDAVLRRGRKCGSLPLRRLRRELAVDVLLPLVRALCMSTYCNG